MVTICKGHLCDKCPEFFAVIFTGAVRFRKFYGGDCESFFGESTWSSGKNMFEFIFPGGPRLVK